MLTITPQASDAIRGILASESIPDGAVIRIGPQEAGPEQEPGLMVSVTDSPPAGDEMIEGDQVEVSVEPNTAKMLEDKELDATVEGDQVAFRIGQQAA